MTDQQQLQNDHPQLSFDTTEEQKAAPEGSSHTQQTNFQQTEAHRSEVVTPVMMSTDGNGFQYSNQTTLEDNNDAQEVDQTIKFSDRLGNGEKPMGASFRDKQMDNKPMESDLTDGLENSRESLGALSNDQINQVMKEEQNEFSYEDMDKGSNKSFSGVEDGANDGSPGDASMSLDMGQLIQNPGRKSTGEDGSGGAKTNIFAGKVRKTAKAADPNQRRNQQNQEREDDYNRQISSAGDDEDNDEEDDDEPSASEKSFNLKEEMAFEKTCLYYLNEQNWNGLLLLSKQHLQKNHTSSWKAFFYYGIAMYKQGEYVLAIAAFEKAERIYEDDAQLHYNLGLAYFKVGNYQHTVEHLKKCILLDPKHPYAYNNLAFLFNIHMIYKETLNICRQAKEFNRAGHNTHMHWAFAEFKEGNVVKAIKKIRKGVQKQPINAECWIVWGLILRSAGKYKSAKHKFEKAIKLAPRNETAKLELNLVNNLMHFDELLPTDAQLKLSQEAYTHALGLGDNNSDAHQGSQASGGERSLCNIF